MSEKSRFFISCGQNKNSDEVKIAKQVAEEFLEAGFKPYIAVEEQTLLGIKENIFERLKRIEYFLFIDFKRERLSKLDGSLSDLGYHRGSLFSHQELALATFQNYDVLAFHEEGVKKDDFIQKKNNCF